MDLQEVGWGGVEWIDVAGVGWWALVKCSNEPLASIKCGEFFDKLRTG
jgi:hypothetical protein